MKLRALLSEISRRLRGTPMDHNQRWFIGYGIAANISINLAGGVFLSGYLAYLGVSETVNGILMAVPVLATVFQPVGAMLGARSGGLKKHVITFTVFERLLFSALYFVPLLFAGGMRGGVVALLYLLANIGTAIVTPSYNEWMMRLVPPQQRHEFFGKREIALLLGLVVAFLAGGLLMDHARAAGAQLQSYFVLSAVLAALAVVIVFCLTRVDSPPNTPPERMRLSTLAMPLKDRRYMLAMGVVCLYQVAQQLVGPYWSIYQLSTLKLSYSFINILTVVGFLLRMFCLNFLMKYLRQRSWSWIFGASLGVVGIAYLLYTFTTYENGSWYIWIPALFSNLGWSFLGLALLNFQYDNIDREDRSIYMAVGAVVTGVVGFLATLLGGAVLEGVNALRAAVPWFNLAGQQVQMFLSGGLYLTGFAVMRRLSKRGKVT